MITCNEGNGAGAQPYRLYRSWPGLSDPGTDQTQLWNWKAIIISPTCYKTDQAATGCNTRYYPTTGQTELELPISPPTLESHHHMNHNEYRSEILSSWSWWWRYYFLKTAQGRAVQNRILYCTHSKLSTILPGLLGSCLDKYKYSSLPLIKRTYRRGKWY